MTIEEQREYDALTSKQRAYYDKASKENPDWSHKQCLTYAAITMRIDTFSGCIDDGIC